MGDDLFLLLQKRIARLQSLLETSRVLHGSIDVAEIAHTVVRVAVKELELAGAELEPADGNGHFAPVSFGRTEAGNRENATSLHFELSSAERGPLGRLRLHPRPGQAMEIDEQTFLEGFVLQAALALDNAVTHTDRLRFERLSRDLETAKAIQRGLIPTVMPDIPGFALAARSEACYEVGGDYLDVFSPVEGRYVFVVADVAGKGLSSALIAQSFRATLRALARTGMPLDELARQLNDIHGEDGDFGRRKYVTAVVAELDPAANRLSIVSAGHNPGFLRGADGALREIKSSGTPLGMLPDMDYTQEVIDLEGGDALLLYTDGISEAAHGDDEFGHDRLVAHFRGAMGLDPSNYLASLWGEVLAFEAGGAVCDDKTVLMLERRR